MLAPFLQLRDLNTINCLCEHGQSVIWPHVTMELGLWGIRKFLENTLPVDELYCKEAVCGSQPIFAQNCWVNISITSILRSCLGCSLAGLAIKQGHLLPLCYSLTAAKRSLPNRGGEIQPSSARPANRVHRNRGLQMSPVPLYWLLGPSPASRERSKCTKNMAKSEASSIPKP